VGGACGTHGRAKKPVHGFDGKVRRKRPLGRPSCRREDGIKMEPREVGSGGCGVYSPGLGYGSLAGSCVCGDEPSDSVATVIYILYKY
jgi:hypothetical protein